MIPILTFNAATRQPNYVATKGHLIIDGQLHSEQLVRWPDNFSRLLKHYQFSYKELNYSANQGRLKIKEQLHSEQPVRWPGNFIRLLKHYQFLHKKPYYSSGLAWHAGDEIIQLRCKNAARPAAEGENALRHLNDIIKARITLGRQQS